MPSTQSDTQVIESYAFGPHTVGAKLTINPDLSKTPLPDLTTFDVETDGTPAQNFVGIGFCPNLQTVWYFTRIDENVIRLLTKCRLIGHDVKADLHFMKKAGIDVPLGNVFADTMLMSYVQDSSKRKHGLKGLAREIFNHVWPEYEEMTDHYRTHLGLQAVEKVANYCGMDALETLRLFYHFTKTMSANERRLHYCLELPMAKILYLREEMGILIDVEYLKSVKAELMPEQEALESKLVDVAIERGFKHSFKKNKKGVVRTITGKEFNPNSPEQAVTFFNMLGFDVDNAKAETREPLMHNPTVKLFDDFKSLQKITGTYVDGLLELPTLPFVHTEFRQAQTITTRLSSANPNLQNIPSRDERFGPMFRRVFVPRPGHIFLDGDYSAMDLRTAAHISQEPVYLEAFNNGRDPHRETASKVFRVPLDQVTKKQRNDSKTINFGVLYGEKEQKLARQLGLTEQQAISLLNDYWKGMPKLKEWIDRVKWSLRKKGGVSTLMGRFIRYPAIWADNKYVRWEAERQSVNAIIQGSNAEILKLADINLYTRYGILATLPVHDELLTEVQDTESEVQRIAPQMQYAMETAVQLTVPMTVEISKGYSWKDAKDESNRVLIAQAA